jgi:hypothetical protein
LGLDQFVELVPVAHFKKYRERCSLSIHVTALSFLSKSESQVSATADTSTNSIAFFAQILSLLLPISIDKLTGMLANCNCLPHTQSGGTQQGIVLKRGILTAVSSVEQKGPIVLRPRPPRARAWGCLMLALTV